jgi:hypothetical protein
MNSDEAFGFRAESLIFLNGLFSGLAQLKVQHPCVAGVSLLVEKFLLIIRSPSPPSYQFGN